MRFVLQIRLYGDVDHRFIIVADNSSGLGPGEITFLFSIS
jgi:hypothetical protein